MDTNEKGFFTSRLSAISTIDFPLDLYPVRCRCSILQ
jgi:hypothetical protein